MPSNVTTKRIALSPARQYLLPGGPLADDLGKIDLQILSDFRRGSDEDSGYGNKR